MDTTKKEKKVYLQTSSEPLLRGRHFAGSKAEGEVCLDAQSCTEENILVLKGDENISADLKLSGFIIEDESDVLAEKLNEYFNVPVITGVNLARKILKNGERVQLDGSQGLIFEVLTEEKAFIEEKTPELTTVTDLKSLYSIDPATIPEPETAPPAPPIHSNETPVPAAVATVPVSSSAQNASSAEVKVEPQLPKDDLLDEVFIEYRLQDPSPAEIREPEKKEKKDEQFDVSKLLDLVDREEEIEVKPQNEAEEVKGISEKEQYNLWGNSLEKVMTASSTVSPITASTALEQVIETKNSIDTFSKEISFDTEEAFIGGNVHVEEEEGKVDYACSFIPTATKVYVNLIDERLPKEFKNFDGIIFSSSFDRTEYLKLLEDTLASSGGKDVFAVTPPYEQEALEEFFKEIYDLRNKGNRNLSLILPDYRNKKEIAELKKRLSSVGLRRSSTFNIFANISRGINLFKLSEIDSSIVDGLYFDLFRLKMNILGVEKLTASTNYAEGMRNMVEYINDNIEDSDRTVLNITGFRNTQIILKHVLQFKFWAVATSLPNVDKTKKKISSLEQKNILELNTVKRKRKLNRK